MEPTNRSQDQTEFELHGLQHVDYTVYPYYEYVPNSIKPCSTLDAPALQPNVFHLLSCGHIVAVDEDDRHCARNCQHVVEWAAIHRSSTWAVGNEYSRIPDDHLPPPSHMQLHDDLYCETCTGIPIERYKALRPPTSELLPTAYPSFRRCLALTLPTIRSVTGLTEEQAKVLLSAPFSNPQHRGFGLKNWTHVLRCGHEVRCTPTRPCGYNCVDAPQCRGRYSLHTEKQSDVVVCKECVMRAELVYTRYANLEAARDREQN
ncbi:hypothetical protein EJ02DRAFT_449671 [Clathrospora elynae]|uniref:Uncharacterized protein n=1 Tax=Clathrospora elynae TaxID=706981 RepID=A0A6A5T4G6_9PLEO|nr:hypothetical protein EJ02DRAFT_449671 [Clathrospora elynae]